MTKIINNAIYIYHQKLFWMVIFTNFLRIYIIFYLYYKLVHKTDYWSLSPNFPSKLLHKTCSELRNCWKSTLPKKTGLWIGSKYTLFCFWYLLSYLELCITVYFTEITASKVVWEVWGFFENLCSKCILFLWEFALRLGTIIFNETFGIIL